MRIDDPRHAQHWRGWHAGTSSRYFHGALGSPESTPAALASHLVRTGARQLLLCGDSTRALAKLLELARQAWEYQELRTAAVVGRDTHRGAVPPAGDSPAPFTFERALLLDRRSRDLRREHRAAYSRSMGQALPAMVPQPDSWQEQLLAMLNDMPLARRRRGGGAALVNRRVVPWTLLPADRRDRNIGYLRSQLTQLEDVDFVPVVPTGGPATAAEFERIGTVQARRLSARRTWTRRSGDELSGDAGDWRVRDNSGDERTVRDMEFRASHLPLGGEEWRRTGRYIAWQVRETQVVRTMEGRAIAQPGDWVVEGYGGERWPVTDEQFRRTYRPVHGHLAP